MFGRKGGIQGGQEGQREGGRKFKYPTSEGFNHKERKTPLKAIIYGFQEIISI